ALRQVHGGPASGAGDAADIALEVLDLQRAQRAHEVLLAEELEERDEVAVLGGAAPVREARAALHVRGAREGRAAARARESSAQRRRRSLVLVYQDEEIEHCAGREREALHAVEPEGGAGQAEIDVDGRAVVRLECPLRHLPAAAGTGERHAGSRRGGAAPAGAPARGPGGPPAPCPRPCPTAMPAPPPPPAPAAPPAFAAAVGIE